mgnify:CR=1 FL=1
MTASADPEAGPKRGFFARLFGGGKDADEVSEEDWDRTIALNLKHQFFAARNVAAEVARRNVQVNAVGTNFMDFPEFIRANGADDPEVGEPLEDS